MSLLDDFDPKTFEWAHQKALEAFESPRRTQVPFAESLTHFLCGHLPQEQVRKARKLVLEILSDIELERGPEFLMNFRSALFSVFSHRIAIKSGEEDAVNGLRRIAQRVDLPKSMRSGELRKITLDTPLIPQADIEKGK